MPANITDVDAFTAPVQTPASGETRTAASVATPIQGLSNRTRWLYSRALDTIGVTAAALKAIVAPANGAFRVVTDAGALGLYRFRTGSPIGTDYSPFVFDATDGTGYWESVMARLLTLGGYGGAQPRLNTSVIRAPNSIINIFETVETSPNSRDVNPTTGGATWDDTGFEVTQAHTIGDKVLLKAGFGLACVTDVGCLVRLAVTSGGTTGIDGTQRSITADVAGFTTPVELSGLYVIPATGNYTFKVQVNSTAGNDVRLYQHRRWEQIVVRP